MSNPAPQGTSIAVLAHYLSYGIEVAPVRFPERRFFVKEVDLFLSSLLLTNGNMQDENIIGIGHVLPVLRSFDDLCKPLDNGLVPAIKLAYMIFDGMVGDGDEVHAGLDHFGNVVVAAGAVRVMSITPDWLFYPEDGNHAGPAEYRKLLEWHFAVGLEPHQYIRKQSVALGAQGADV